MLSIVNPTLPQPGRKCQVSLPTWRPDMTPDDVEEINAAESRALDWQAVYRRNPSRFNARYARLYTEECLALAEKYAISTVVKPFNEVAK